jgi:hypothetical protein
MQWLLPIVREAGLEALSGTLGWLVLILIFIPVFSIIYFVMKRMGYGRTRVPLNLNVNVGWGTPPRSTPAGNARWVSTEGVPSANASVVTPAGLPIADVAAIQSAVQAELCPPPLTEKQRAIVDFTEKSRNVLLPIYRILNRMLAGGLLLGALYSWHVATPANGIYLVSILLFALAVIVYAQYKEDEDEREDTGALAFLDNLSATNCTSRVEMKAPMVFSLSSTAMRTAEEMQQQGQDLDAVCRAINSEYAAMPRLEQRLFRATLEAALKSPRPG